MTGLLVTVYYIVERTWRVGWTDGDGVIFGLLELLLYS